MQRDINLDNNVKIAVSTVKDGTMKKNGSTDPSVVDAQRTVFLSKHTISLKDTVLVQLVYEGDDYCRYHIVNETDKGDGMTRSPHLVSDGLLTQASGVALFLPLADCVGAVIYDHRTNSLMLSHLGRHNLEQQGAKKSIEFMTSQTGARPEDIKVWLSPAAGSESYPLFSMEEKGLHQVTCEQLLDAGVTQQNVVLSPVDTTIDTNYFSHSEFLKGHRESDGRFAVVAMLK